jgi:hypothetical protein
MKWQKRFVICLTLLIFGLAFPSASLAQSTSMTVSVPDLTAQANANADITIKASGAQGIGAMHIELVYDPQVLTWVSVNPGTLANGSLIDAGADTPGRLVVSMATVKPLNGDGAIAIARFKVTGASGNKSQLTLENVSAWEGETYREIQVVMQSGKLTVGGGSSMLLIIIGAAMCLFVLGLLALFLILRANRRPKQPVMVSYPAGPQYAAPPPPVQQAGRPASVVVYCKNCGTPNTPGSRFCPNCGAALTQK